MPVYNSQYYYPAMTVPNSGPYVVPPNFEYTQPVQSEQVEDKSKEPVKLVVKELDSMLTKEEQLHLEFKKEVNKFVDKEFIKLLNCNMTSNGFYNLKYILNMDTLKNIKKRMNMTDENIIEILNMNSKIMFSVDKMFIKSIHKATDEHIKTNDIYYKKYIKSIFTDKHHFMKKYVMDSKICINKLYTDQKISSVYSFERFNMFIKNNFETKLIWKSLYVVN